MKLKHLISLRILCVLAYVNLLFTVCTLIFYETFYYILDSIFEKNFYLGLEDISNIYLLFLIFAYFLIITAIVELARGNKSKSINHETQNTPLIKKIFNFIDSCIFYSGLFYELCFVIFYTFLLVMV